MTTQSYSPNTQIWQKPKNNELKSGVVSAELLYGSGRDIAKVVQSDEQKQPTAKGRENTIIQNLST